MAKRSRSCNIQWDKKAYADGSSLLISRDGRFTIRRDTFRGRPSFVLTDSVTSREDDTWSITAAKHRACRRALRLAPTSRRRHPSDAPVRRY